MKQTECPTCGAPMTRLARVCGYCGTRNPSRRKVAIVAGVLSLLGLAAVIAIVIVLVSPRLSDQSTAEQRAAAAGDFSWLEKAMKDCDAEAARTPGALYFLVTPLVDTPRDEPGWRKISVNDIGNGILISAEDMLAGLQRKALQLSSEEYTFAARVEATKEAFGWKQAAGVKKFVKEDAGGIEAFQVRFQSRDPASGLNWGATIKRQPGNCYWVNAILRL